jgi:DNA polymerase-4
MSAVASSPPPPTRHAHSASLRRWASWWQPAARPDAILLPVDFPAYRHCSRLFKTAVASIAPDCEDRGIDEIYLDLSRLAGDSRPLAQRIKDAVRQATGLSCSIGVAPNKLLAKIASDLDKPDGLTILGSDDLRQRIWPLPVRKINGIGPKASERLALLGIERIGQLAAADAGVLRQHFGRSYGTWLLAAANGIDERPLITAAEPKSVSRETTFERDLHPRDDRETLSAVLVGPLRQAGRRPAAQAMPRAARSASSCALPISASSRAT